MSKRNILLIAILVALPIVYFLLNRDIETNASIGKNYFSIKNLEQIDRIFISENSTKKHALLTKDKNNIWKINNKWVVNESRMRILLETIRDIEVKYEVDQGAAEQITTQIAATGVKTLIYSGDKLLKSYFVGTPTSTMLGTYMLETKSTQPVVVHIPGMNGFISSRYFTDSIEWRNKNIFNIPKESIKKIEVEWNKAPTNSFSINVDGTKVGLTNSQGKSVSGLNELKVKAFLNLFMVYEKNNLACEGFHKEFSPAKADSIANSNWFYKIEVTQKNNKKTSLKLFRKPIQVNTYDAYDEQGNLMDYEIDKYWGIQNDEKLIMEIQDLVFAKILKKIDDFK